MDKNLSELAKHCAATFGISTDINTFVTDINEPNGESGCEKGFCSKLQSVIDTKFDCLNCHLSAARQAERFGGKYIYFCPAGFVHFASPVISNDNLAGAIVAARC